MAFILRDCPNGRKGSQEKTLKNDYFKAFQTFMQGQAV